MKISVVTPIRNEEKNIKEFFDILTATLESHDLSYEAIAVDDGSTDKSFDELSKIAKENKHVKVISFQRNFGQTAAISAGISNATGDIIIPIDSDLENDPRDIPALLEKLDEGYDVVSGWRQKRWAGKWLTRKLPSTIANWMISALTGVTLHDYGCTLKAYRHSVIAGVRLYGEMHRFIPAYAAWQGARVTEIVVAYQPRKYGTSNYGISRTFRVLLDLVVLKFLTKYMNRPMHFFGGIGFGSLAIGFLLGLLAVILKIFGIRDFVATPLPEITALFVIVGVQLAVMGVLAEMIMRTYYESQDKTSYSIKEKVNF